MDVCLNAHTISFPLQAEGTELIMANALIIVIYICWRRGQVDFAVQRQHGHRCAYSLLLPLCADGHSQFATCLMTVQGGFEMVSRPTNSYFYSNLHEEDIDIDWAYRCLSRPVADVISGEASQRFGQEITGIGPMVCSFSFSYSTAKFLIRTMHVLISSRGLCFTTFRFHACADGTWDKTLPVAH